MVCEGVDGFYMPLPTHPKQYCDPASLVYVSVLEGGVGRALGVDGGWLPLSTPQQRYCDPESLVFI